MFKKTAFLLLFALLQFFTSPLFAQNLKNRTEEMYPFGTVIIAKEPLPDKVYASQKDKIIVSVVYFEKGTSNIVMSSVGTGFVSKIPGIILTVRHLLVETVTAYDYVFMGTIVTDSARINFPLFLIAKGEAGTFKDLMVLKTDVETLVKARTDSDIVRPNPYSLLLRTSEFADAKVDGKKVYISGFAPTVSEYFNKNNQPTSVYVDLINFTFTAEITAPVIDMPINKLGIRKLFRLIDSAESGFSGGKVMNDNGQVIGMTIAASVARNFVYAISSKDIDQFLKDNKIK